MAIAYICPPGDMPDCDKEYDFLWHVQDNSWVSWFETQTWQVEVKLGIFQTVSTSCT